MKRIIYLLLTMLVFVSCTYDNYDPPKTKLTGRFVYEGNPVEVRQGLNVIRLYEPGWKNFDPIGVNVKQDGTFSASLYNGSYQLILINGNGPWTNNPDTIEFQVDGRQELDIPVEPFFMVKNVKFEVQGTKLKANFNIEQIVNSAKLQYISLYIGETMLVDNQFKTKEERLPSGEIESLNDPMNLELDLSEVKHEFIFARIGVKTIGNPELIFSSVEKIDFP